MPQFGMRSSSKQIHPLDLAPLAVAVVAVLTAIVPFRAGEAILAYFQDDFFYYLQVAKNLAEYGRSTFDGTTLTNGYHPLWLLLLTILWLPGHGRIIFAAVVILIVAGTLICYFLTRCTSVIPRSSVKVCSVRVGSRCKSRGREAPGHINHRSKDNFRSGLRRESTIRLKESRLADNHEHGQNDKKYPGCFKNEDIHAL
jgi:hypothetical protein